MANDKRPHNNEKQHHDQRRNARGGPLRVIVPVVCILLVASAYLWKSTSAAEPTPALIALTSATASVTPTAYSTPTPDATLEMAVTQSFATSVAAQAAMDAAAANGTQLALDMLYSAATNTAAVPTLTMQAVNAQHARATQAAYTAVAATGTAYAPTEARIAAMVEQQRIMAPVITWGTAVTVVAVIIIVLGVCVYALRGRFLILAEKELEQQERRAALLNHPAINAAPRSPVGYTWDGTTATRNAEPVLKPAINAEVENELARRVRDAGWKFGDWLRNSPGGIFAGYAEYHRYRSWLETMGYRKKDDENLTTEGIGYMTERLPH